MHNRKWLHTVGYGLYLLNSLRCYIVQPGCVGSIHQRDYLTRNNLSSQIDSFIYLYTYKTVFRLHTWLMEKVKHCRTGQRSVVLDPGFIHVTIIACSASGCVNGWFLYVIPKQYFFFVPFLEGKNPWHSSQDLVNKEWFSPSKIWSPGLVTHNRTVVYVCFALPLSSKSSSTQEIYRDKMENTPSCLSQCLPRQ